MTEYLNKLVSLFKSNETNSTPKPKCKICCACPTQRRSRDECFILNGYDKCQKEIEDFYNCLYTEGFSKEEVEQLA